MGGLSTLFTRTYNSRLQPWTISAVNKSQTVFSLTYDFHVCSGNNGDNGNVCVITNNLNGGRTQTFFYDRVNRLSTASFYGGSDQYAYDNWGNLLSKTVASGSGETWNQAVTANNQFSGWGYDASGNMTNTHNGPYHNVYDAENQWTYERVNGVSYLYNGDGQRVESSGGASGTRIYVYDPAGKVIREVDQNGNTLNDYFYLGSERMGRATLNGIYFYYGDHLGTSRVITDGSNICYDSDYFPWGGEIQVFTSNCPQNYKFTGKERDPDLGVDYFEARFYQDSMARFYSPDQMGGSMLDPQTLNRYAYVRNNPCP